MIRYRLFSLFAVLALAAGSVSGATWTWTGADATDGDDWSRPDNWNTDPGDANIPGVGAYVGDNVRFTTKPDNIDLKGISVNVGQFYVDNDNQNFVDTTGTAVIIATEIYVDDRTFNVNFDPNLVVSGRIYVRSKADIDNFYGTVTADSLDLGATSPLFHQAVTITNVPTGLEVFYRSVATGGNTNYRFDDVVNASKARIWSDVVSQTATLSAQDGNTLSGVTGAVTIDSGGILNLAVAQNTFPGGGIQINEFGLLVGDTGTATWGDANNIRVANNAILATSAGTLPTEADLGLASGVKDAVAWQGILDDGTYTVGDDGDSIYKGMAFGGFTAGQYQGKTLQAPVGAGDLALAWTPGSPGAVPGDLTLESLDGTGVANIEAYTTLSFKGGQWNASPTATTVSTFNIVGKGASTTDLADFEQANDFTIRDEQTFNFSGAGRVDLAPTTTLGQVTFSGETMLTVSNDGQFPGVGTAPNAKLTFGAGTAVSVGSADVLALEQMSASQIVVDPGAVLTLETGGSNDPLSYNPQFDITDANNPRLVALMKSVNVMVKGGNNNYADMQGDGIQLGDGKYLIGYSDSHKGVYLRADPNFPNAKIHGAGSGTTMGIGCASNNASDYLGIHMPIDAHGGTVQLNGVDPVLYVLGGSNNRGTAVANQSVRLYGTINNAVEVVVLNKEVSINSDTVDDGALIGGTLPIRVAGTGDLSIGTAVADLSNTQFTIEQGGRVYVNNDLTVKNLILNSTYAAGNDGLQINDADDEVTVTGTLSGSGQWGDSGRIVVTGTVSPGNSIGELGGAAGGDLTLDSAVYEWQLANPEGDNATGEDWDMITGDDLVITGDLELALNLSEYNPGTLAALYIVAAFNTIDATGAGVLSVSSTDGWKGTLSVDGGNLVVSDLGLAITPGDTNGDDVVDAADFITVKRNFGGGVGGDASVGNFDGIGTVDWADLNTLLSNFGAGGGAPLGGLGPAVTPEPATLGLLMVGALTVMRRRRRK